MSNAVNEARNTENSCADAVPSRKNKPDQVKRDIRSFEREFAEGGVTWPAELHALTRRKVLALQMRDQENLPPVMERENLKDIEAFDVAHAALVAKGE